jgi:PAS domain S-box-containing protein
MKPPRDDIALRAYSKWLERGCPPNTQLQDWVEAEAELRLLGDDTCGLVEQQVRESGYLLQSILDNSPAVVYVKDARGRYLLINRRYETLFKVTRTEVVGKTDYDLFPRDKADAYRANDLRVLVSRTAQEFEEVVPHDDGLHTYISLKFPIAAPGGAFVAVCGISTDITDRKRIEQRLIAEHAVARALARSAALPDAGPRILEVVATCLGCDLGLLWNGGRTAGELSCLALWRAPGVEAPQLEQVSRESPFTAAVGSIDHRDSGEAVWIADLASVGTPRARIAVAEGLHGMLASPIRERGVTLGMLEFFSRKPRVLDAGAREMLASISRQIAQFIEHREAERTLHERARELGVARQIQQGLLPKGPPALPGMAIGAACEPAHETGGDYLDFIPVADGTLGIVIGDASGHGVGAALLMAETRAYLRARAATDSDPAAILTRVDRSLAPDLSSDHFVTLFLACLDPATRRLTWASAGHLPGFILDARGEVKRSLPATGFPLGLNLQGIVSGPPRSLEPGDLLFLLTDGIVEACSPAGGPFGMERALEVVRTHRAGPPQEIVAALLQQARRFSGGEMIDDMTAIIVKVAS